MLPARTDSGDSGTCQRIVADDTALRCNGRTSKCYGAGGKSVSRSGREPGTHWVLGRDDVIGRLTRTEKRSKAARAQVHDSASRWSWNWKWGQGLECLPQLRGPDRVHADHLCRRACVAVRKRATAPGHSDAVQAPEGLTPIPAEPETHCLAVLARRWRRFGPCLTVPRVDMRLPDLLGSGHQVGDRVSPDERDLAVGCALVSGVLLHGVRGMC